MTAEGKATRVAPRELSEEEFAELDFERFRCTQCTPCCTYHTHFIYRGKILWTCGVKLRDMKKEDLRMSEPTKLTLPASREELAELRIGDEVLLSGCVYTMRDAGHQRALDALHATGKLPCGLEGATLFYAGPTPAAAGRPLGSVGPTTASRMDFATPALMKAGIVACIGKGKRSAEVVKACKDTGSVYFAAVGGIAALLATHVEESELIAWEDLGTEALRKLELRDLPCFVAVDTQGGDLYREIEAGATTQA